MQKAFITGISGFVGSHLADYLLDLGNYEIHGTYLSEKSLRNVEHIQDRLTLYPLDLQDQEKTQEVVKSASPDLIFHLAALPAVGHSLDNPRETLVNNITAELSLLQAVKNLHLDKSKLLVVTSADVYGKVAQKDIPIDEQTPFMPTNAYAVSKIAQDYLALQYQIAYNLPIVRVRPFNHFGPRQASGFVVADFAIKIVEIEKGKKEPILKVGTLETRRDFTDVRDIVHAYEILIQKGVPGEVYNVGRGRSYRIQDILDSLVSQAKVSIKIEVDPSLIRPEDAPDRVCDNTKFKELSGWEPTIPLEQTLKDTLDYWRNIL